MVSPDNFLPILKERVAKFLKDIDGWLKKLSFKPQAEQERMTTMSVEMQNLLQMTQSALGGAASGMSIFDNLKRFGEESDILTENASTVANTIKFGYALGTAVLELYEKASGMENLRQIKKASSLDQGRLAEFEQRQVTGGAISLFVSACYIVWKLNQYKANEVEDRVIPNLQLPEFTIINAQQAMKFSLYYFGKFVSAEQVVGDDIALIKFAIDYFTVILNELDLYKSSLQFCEEFEKNNYKLEDSEFVVRGFDRQLQMAVVVKEFKKVKWDEIVGNRDFKHTQQRLIQSLMCYDPIIKMNPMLELGGGRTVTLGFGWPGTGKSLLIAATATDIEERCKDLKIPFLFWPWPIAIVDEFQGKSAKNAAAWFQVLRDTGKIIYAPIDDAENTLVSRSNKSASEGNRGTISVFLTETEGASAVLHGNYAIQSFTNRPEDLDSAALSRHQTRTKIEGAVTWQDFLDQDYLWWKKYEGYQSDFVNAMGPKDYTYFANQRLVASLSKLYESSGEVIPQNDTVRDIYHKVSKDYNPEKEHAFYGHFFAKVKEAFPFFTSRDVRNIQSAISDRIMDFDFPASWMKDNSVFFSKDYATKKEMLIEQMRENMKGLSFMTARKQETIKYIDATIAINETKFETAVKERLEQMQVYEEAEKRFKNKN